MIKRSKFVSKQFTRSFPPILDLRRFLVAIISKDRHSLPALQTHSQKKPSFCHFSNALLFLFTRELKISHKLGKIVIFGNNRIICTAKILMKTLNPWEFGESKRMGHFIAIHKTKSPLEVI